MDVQTLEAYNQRARSYARDWIEQDAPDDMYRLLRQYFQPGPTADVGCGAGRDTAWLAANGFVATGFDASEGLIEEARATYPNLTFRRADLPGLDGVERGAYQNVLCETVVMHLEPASIKEAINSLVGLVCAGGTLYISWRVTEGKTIRDDAGRLYSSFDRELVVVPLLEKCDLLFEEDVTSASSRKRVERLVARKRAI
ncbi:class I SAM-dependent methyltransferase [Paraburkholderia sp. PREW-6R]|uniref:class I SAM-dependent methyltransferase n=1 Tax=Paraburkholderia sp. PREW-6R TaxID=3141544 RepID=UPI0031F4D7F6